MKFSRVFFSLNAYLTLVLALVAVVGDILVKHSDLYLFRAIFDNCTHAVIGGLCWLVFYVNSDKNGSTISKSLLEIFGCAIISSVIDLDHFVAAKSLHLKDATNLRHRPFLHCSTIPVALFFLLILTSYVFQVASLKRFALIFLTAFMSHHVRDATRRGLWFYPYGSTAPIPYGFYVILTCLIPYFMLILDRYVKVDGISPRIDSSVI